MSILKSVFGLISCAVYVLIAFCALLHDLTYKPGPLILPFAELMIIVALPGLILLDPPLELMGLKINEGSLHTPVLVASALLTAGMVYLLGAGIEALYRSMSRKTTPPNTRLERTRR